MEQIYIYVQWCTFIEGILRLKAERVEVLKYSEWYIKRCIAQWGWENKVSLCSYQRDELGLPFLLHCSAVQMLTLKIAF